MTRPRNVLVISGFAGSGKSTFAAYLANAMSGYHINFGALTRSIAEDRGIVPSRENLVRLGKQLVRQLGMEGFVRLAAPPQSAHTVIYDGVRDVEAYTAVRSVHCSDQVKLVFLELDLETRQARLLARKRTDDEISAIMAVDALELATTSLVALRDMADYLLDANETPEMLLLRIV